MKHIPIVLMIALLPPLAGGQALADNLSIYGAGEARPEILLVQRRVAKVCVKWRGSYCTRWTYERRGYPKPPQRVCPWMMTGPNCDYPLVR